MLACTVIFLERKFIMNTNEFLIDFYKTHDEQNRLVTKQGYVEYMTTMKYIEKHLKPDSRILEIGAGTGRYSHDLARKGYKVDALELVDHNIEIFEQNTLPEEKITITQGNAIDLSNFKTNTYDITLLLGPMYHLYTNDDKVKALSEAIRVTKCGGIVFVAYCMADASILLYCFGKGQIHNDIKAGRLNPETFKTHSNPSDIFELYRKEDIDLLRSRFNVTQLAFIATDGYTNHMKETINQMDDETYELYLKYHLTICERQEMIGLSHHTLDIFRKEE